MLDVTVVGHTLKLPAQTVRVECAHKTRPKRRHERTSRAMDLEALQHLQEVDIQRDAALRELRTVADQLSDPPNLDRLDAEIAAQTDEVQKAELAAREAKAQVQTAERRIELADKRLYSGTITDHRTLEELQRDLYSQRQQLGPLSDAETRAAGAADASREAESWLIALRTGFVDGWNATQSQLRQEHDAGQERVDGFSRQIDQARASIAEDDLKVYDEYRRRRPRVVANVNGGVCEECRLTVPTVSVTRARRGDRVVDCPSCGCILRVT